MTRLEQFNQVFKKLSPRERGLAVAVGVLCLVGICFTVGKRTTNRLDALERKILTKQSMIVKYNHQIARRQSVDSQYARIAAQHSSGWSDPEVMDRLGQEIYRLAQKVPPALDEDGVPFSTTTPYGDLVKIPELRQGSVTDSGEGYIEYRMSLQIPAANIMRVVEFIERLQSSPQSLRIEGLQITREPLSTTVRCDLDIARVLAVGSMQDTVPSPVPDPTPTSPPDMLNPDDWTCDGCTIVQTEGLRGDGRQALRVEAEEASAQVSLNRSLPAGTSYDLLLDAQVNQETTLSLRDGATQQELTGGTVLEAANEPKRYHLQFTVPGVPETETAMAVPLLQLSAPGSVVLLDAMRLVEVGV